MKTVTEFPLPITKMTQTSLVLVRVGEHVRVGVRVHLRTRQSESDPLSTELKDSVFSACVQ